MALVRNTARPTWFILALLAGVVTRVVMAGELDPAKLVQDLASNDALTRHVAGVRLRKVGKEAVPALTAGLQSKDAKHRLAVVAVAAEMPVALGGSILISALGDSAVEVRLVAVDHVVAARLSTAGPTLLSLAKSGPPVFAARAVRAAADLGVPLPASDLIPLLQSPQGQVRAVAAKAASRLNDPVVVKAFVPLIGDKDPEVREAAQLCLARNRASQVLPVLQKTLKGDRPAEVGIALRGLAAYRDESVFDTVCQIVKKREKETYSAAIDYVIASDNPKSQAVLLTELAQHNQTVPEDVQGAHKIIDSLGHRGRTSARSVLIVTMWQNGSVPLRVAAAKALGQIVAEGDERAEQVAALGRATLEHPDPEVRAAALGSLGMVDGAAAAAVAARALRADPDPRVCTQAAPLCARPALSAAAVELIASLQHGDAHVRRAAGEALIKSAEPRALGPMLDAVSRRDPAEAGGLKPRHVAALVDALAAQQILPRPGDLKRALRSKEPAIAAAAANAAAALKIETVAPLLTKLLAEGSNAVQIPAAQALGAFGRIEDVPALLKAASDRRHPACTTATNALAALIPRLAEEPKGVSIRLAFLHQVIELEFPYAVKQAAAAELPKLEPADALALARAALQDRWPAVRQAAANYLAARNEKEAVSLLAGLLEDKNKAIANVTLAAMRRVSGLGSGDIPTLKAWWEKSAKSYVGTLEALELAAAVPVAMAPLKLEGLRPVAALELFSDGRAGGEGGIATSEHGVLVACGRKGLVAVDAERKRKMILGKLELPGPALKVCVQEKNAYVAMGGAGMAIVGIDDPKQRLKLVGAFRHGEGNTRDIAVLGGQAFLAIAEEGLQIVDVTKPEEPKLVGQYEARPHFEGLEHLDGHGLRRVLVRGNIAYLGCGPAGLVIVDVQDPAKPALKSQFREECRMDVRDLAVAGNFLYLADSEAGLIVLDVTDASKPKKLCTFHTAQAQAVALDGTRAYVADARYGVRIIDVSDPANPRAVGYHHEARGDYSSIVALGKEVWALSNGYLKILRPAQKEKRRATAFSFASTLRPLLSRSGKPIEQSKVAELYGKEFCIYDDGLDVCSEEHARRTGSRLPRRPVQMDLSDKAGFPDIAVPANCVAIDPATGRFKLSDGARRAMALQGWLNLPAAQPQQIHIDGGIAAVAGREGWGLALVNVSRPDRPALLGVGQTGGLCTRAWVDATKKLAFGGRADGRVVVFDISDGKTPRPIACVASPSCPSVPLAHGNTLLCGTRKKTTVVVDLSAPAAPVITNEVPGTPLALAAGIAYVARDGGLEVLDVRDPKAPKPLGRCELLLGDPEKVCVAGQRAALLHGKVVSLYDTTNPQGLKLLSQTYIDTAGPVLDLAYDGNVLCVVGDRLRVYDASNPANLACTGRSGLLTPETVRSVALAGAHALVVGPHDGLKAWDLADRARPAMAGSLSLSGNDWVELAATASYAFAANRSGGLRVIDITNPAAPRSVAALAQPWPRMTTGIALDGNHLVLGQEPASLAVLDVRSPTRPKVVKDLPAVGHVRPWAARGRLYAGPFVYDLTDPAKALRLDRVPLAPAEPRLQIGRCVTVGDRLYAVQYGDEPGLSIFDVRYPRDVRLLGHLSVPTRVSRVGREIDAKEGFVYLANGEGVLIIDATDSQRPALRATLPLPDVCSVCVRRDLLYATSLHGGLHVIDVADPARPVLIDRFRQSHYPVKGGFDGSPTYQSHCVNGDLAYVLSPREGLQVIAVPHPSERPLGKITARAVLGQAAK